MWFGFATGGFGIGTVILVVSTGRVEAAWVGAGGVGTTILLAAVPVLVELEVTEEVAEEMTAASAALASMLPNATTMKVAVSFILIVVGLF